MCDSTGIFYICETEFQKNYKLSNLIFLFENERIIFHVSVTYEKIGPYRYEMFNTEKSGTV